MIRDLILLAAIGGVLLLIVRSPFVGLLAWLWVTLMNPHQEVYGFLRGAQLNLIIAVLTIGAWAISNERKRIPANAFTVFVVLFALWACVSTYFALDPEHATPLLERNLKTIVLVVAVTILATTRLRLQAVIWVMVISIGYYAVKGGGFVLLTGGGGHVYGPPNSMIADNNSMGLALVVAFPLMDYLRMTSARPIVHWPLLGLMALTMVAILGTFSRGALIASAASGAVYASRSRHAVMLALAAAVLAVALPSILPATWFERMSTIQTYNEDSSFQSRVSAWRTSYNIAIARPLTGGGFAAVEQTWIAKAFPSPGSLNHGRAAHSVYFEVLGDTGFVGLGIYLAALAAAGVNTFRILTIVRGRPELDWAAKLARMIQVSMVGFLSGGAALSMAYYDGGVVIFALTAALLDAVRQPAPIANPGGASVPRWKHAYLAATAARVPWRPRE